MAISKQTIQNIDDVYRADTTSERAVCFWFVRFRSENVNLRNELRGRPEFKVNNEELLPIVEADSSQTVDELAA